MAELQLGFFRFLARKIPRKLPFPGRSITHQREAVFQRPLGIQARFDAANLAETYSESSLSGGTGM